MKLIKGNTAYGMPTNITSRVFEVGENVLLDSIDHDLATLQPYSMNAVDCQTARSGLTMYMNATINNPTLVEASWRNNVNEATEMIDCDNPNIIYKTQVEKYYDAANTDMSFAVYEKQKDGTLLMNYSRRNDYYSPNIRMVHQDSEYIYALMQRQYDDASGNGMNYIWKISKKDFGISTLHFGRTGLNFLYADNVYMYLLGDSTNNYMIFYKVKKSDLSYTSSYYQLTDSAANAWMRQTVDVVEVKENGKTYVECYCVSEGTGASLPVNKVINRFFFIKIRFNPASVLDVTWTEIPFDNLEVFPEFNMRPTSTWTRYHNLRFIDVDTPKDHIVLTITDDRTAANTEYLENSRTMVFDIKSKPGKAKLVSITPLQDVFDAVFFIDQNKTLIHTSYDRIVVSMFKKDEKKYVDVKTIPVLAPNYIYNVGVDKYRRIWYSTMLNQVYMEKIPTPYFISASYTKNIVIDDTDLSTGSSELGEFAGYLVNETSTSHVYKYVDFKVNPKNENDTYLYSKTFETSIKVKIKDIDGNLIKGNVKVSLIGMNQKFKNNSKEIIVSTSTTEDTLVPVLVTGNGALLYNVTLI